MKSVLERVRPNIRDMKPYSSARDEYTGREGIFLDANENALGSSAGGEHNRYPDPHQRLLKEKLSGAYPLQPEQIFLGNGSDEAIDLLIRAFCRPGQDEIIIMPPTYGMYSVCAAVNDVGVLPIQLTNRYEPDTGRALGQANSQTKMIFLCSPNNPTGNVLNRPAIIRLLKEFDGLVVIDQAYIDFCPQHSWITGLSDCENLVVLQTFSKAWGLANIRLGMAFAHPDIVAVLNRIKYPYNVNGITQQIAVEALSHPERMQTMVAEILDLRERLAADLDSLSCVKHVYPSEANFLLVEMADALATYRYLLEERIIVRNRSTVVRCDNCLRITVGSATENRLLIESLNKYRKEQ